MPILAARAHTPRQPLPGGPVLTVATVKKLWHRLMWMTWDHVQGECGQQMVSVHCTVYVNCRYF